MANAERINYLSNFEELVIEYGVGIQHVFADHATPGFSYTVGLFEQGHPEFIVFGMSQELSQIILNDLAAQVLEGCLRFAHNDRVHQLFEGAPAHLMSAHDPQADYFGTSYSIRDRRYPDRSGDELDALQVLYEDPAGRWPWDDACDYDTWPFLGPLPEHSLAQDVTILRD